MFALVTDSAPFQAHSTQQQAKLPWHTVMSNNVM
jgi:hypothetical protein